MPAQAAYGLPATTATTGGAAVVVPEGCKTLGFWANATTTIAIYDAATAAGAVAGNLKVNITACAVGWNPLPMEFINGLVINQAAQVYFSIAGN